MYYLNNYNIKKSKVAENTLALFAASVLDKTFFFILIVYFTRYIGANIYGQYLIVMSFIYIFKTLVNFGLSRLFMRDLARDVSRIEDYLGNSIVISIGLSFVFYIVLLTTIKLLKYPVEIYSLIFIAGLSLFPFSIALRFEAILRAFEYMKKTSVWSVVNSFLSTMSSIVILHLGYGLKGVFIGLFFVNLIYAYCLYFTLRQIKIYISLKYNLMFIFYILKKAFPFALFSVMCIIYYSSGIVILSKMESSEVIGWYGAALRFTETLLIIPSSLGIALFPVMSKHYKHSFKSLWQSYEKALRYLIIIGLPLGVSIAMSSKFIVVLLFGINFVPSAHVMPFLVLATMIIFVNTPASIVIFNSDYFQSFVLFYFVFVLLSIIVNYLFISRYSYIGAGISRLLTEFFMFLIQVCFLILIFNKIPNFIKLSMRPLIATFIIGIGLAVFHSLPLTLLLSCAFSFYFIFLVISREFSKEEITKIKNIFSEYI